MLGSISDKSYPKHPIGGNLTVKYRLSVDARLVSESLYANVSHVLRWMQTYSYTETGDGIVERQVDL